jgi:hypothetical protein
MKLTSNMAKTEALDINWQWNFYLENSNLDPKTTSSEELKKHKDIFYSAFAQAVFLFTTGITQMKPQEEVIDRITQMSIEVEEYFNK